jgi:hypothetical protein
VTVNHSRRTKVVSAIAGAASFALLAARCSSGGTGSSSSTSSSGPVTLTVTTFGSIGTGRALQELRSRPPGHHHQGKQQSARYVDFSVVLAGAVLATLALLILFAVAGRQLISGIMAGAVKG